VGRPPATPERERERDGWREWLPVRTEAVRIRRRKEGRKKEKEKKRKKNEEKKEKRKNIRVLWTFHIFFTLGEAVLPNVFVQNKPESEKAAFSYEPEPELFFQEPEPCQTGPKIVWNIESIISYFRI